MKFDRAIACLRLVGEMVHGANARQAHMTGDAEAEASHAGLAAEFAAACEALRAVQGLEEMTKKMAEQLDQYEAKDEEKEKKR